MKRITGHGWCVLRQLSLLLLPLALSACRTHPPRTSPPEKPEYVECSVRGVQDLYPTTYLFSEGEQPKIIARFYGSGHPLGITLSRLGVGGGARTRAEIRAPASGPAFVLRGVVELRELDLYLSRELPVVPGHVGLVQGAQVHLLRGSPQGRARVRASHGAFPSLVVDAPCDALRVGPLVGIQATRSVAGAADKQMHIARAGVVLRNEQGAPLLDLGTDGKGVTVRILETRGDLRHVLYDDGGVRLDGFLFERDLLPGHGPDCDDCQGSIRDGIDRCPDSPTLDDGCPGPRPRIAKAVRDADVLLHASPESLVIGRIEQGADILVGASALGKPDSPFVNVRPRRGELEPGVEFWVERSALSVVE